jgi:hypothetical protein
VSIAELAINLRATIADLDAYITRRAHEVSEPVIERLRAAADEQIAAAKDETRRQQDLVRELRRRLAAREQQAGRWRNVADVLAAVLAPIAFCPTHALGRPGKGCPACGLRDAHRVYLAAGGSALTSTPTSTLKGTTDDR